MCVLIPDASVCFGLVVYMLFSKQLLYNFVVAYSSYPIIRLLVSTGEVLV